jgi:hypothetical protein
MEVANKEKKVCQRRECVAKEGMCDLGGMSD